MLHTISWKVFFSLMLGMVSFYWLIVLFIYYRFSFMNWVHKSLHPGEDRGDALGKPGQRMKGRMNDSELEILFPEVYALIGELKQLFQVASDKGFPKEELMMALQLKLRAYGKFIGTAFQPAVNNFIEAGVRDWFSIGLDPGELNILWQR
jgi:hypothetical protein